MDPAFRFRYFGLTLASDVPLPLGVLPSDEPADIALCFADRQPPLPMPLPFRRFLKDERGWLLHYGDGNGGWGAYQYARQDRCLLLSGSVPRENFLPPLYGAVAAALWRCNGALVLHGCAVDIGSSRIALLGPSGAGKSTFAAALLARGGRLVSDDVLVLAEAAADPAISPGPGRLSLSADSMAALDLDSMGATGATPRQGSAKSWLDVPAAANAVRLSEIVILKPDGAEDIQMCSLAPRSAVLELTRHVYGADWIGEVRGEDLMACAALASRIPIRTLAVRRGFACLERAVDTVLGT